jgi:hypothetical protein
MCFWRQSVFTACLLFFLGVVHTSYGQPKRFRPLPQYVQLGEPDQARGREILADFRTRGIEGDYYWEFELQVLPRVGEETAIPGRIWGGRNDDGPITRIALWPGVVGRESRLLVQNGPKNATWGWRAERAAAGVAVLGAAAWFEPLAETDLTAFDLQMPFVYWNDFVFEGVANYLNRPAHVFLFYPPAEIAALRPSLTGVRVYLDTAYRALVKCEQIGERGQVTKTLTLGAFIKVDERWIVKSGDFRDEATRNKTRFLVTHAAMGLELPAGIFEPASLSESLRPPPADRIRSVAR